MTADSVAMWPASRPLNTVQDKLMIYMPRLFVIALLALGGQAAVAEELSDLTAIRSGLSFDSANSAPVVQWVAAVNGAVPADAIIGGNESGRALPVCRASYKSGVHPGKLVGKTCNFGYGGNEVLATQFDVLVGNPVLLKQNPGFVRWIAVKGGQLPAGALMGAFEPGSAILLICQAPYQGGVHVGKVYSGSCYFGYGGREVPSSQYAVLVVGALSNTAPASTPQLVEFDAKISNFKAALASLNAEPPIGRGSSGLIANRISMQSNAIETLTQLDTLVAARMAAIVVGGVAADSTATEKFHFEATALLKTMALSQADIQKLIWEIIQDGMQNGR